MNTLWLRQGALALMATASLSLTACGEDGDENTQGGASNYIVVGSVTTPEGSTTFVQPVGSLDKSASFTLGDDFMEVSAGNNRIAVDPYEDGVFYVGSGESGTLTKWSVSETGTFSQVSSLSFAGRGINRLDGTRNPFQFVSATKAYYIDTRAAQVVIWNPTEMSITDSIAIEGLVPNGLTMSSEGGNFVHQSGTRFLTSVRFLTYENDSPTGASPISRIVIVDSQDDSVKVISEDVCGHVAFSATNSKGDVYFGSHTVQALWVAGDYGGDDMTDPCIVRVENGADEVDSDYLVKLNTLFNRPTGALIQGGGDTAYTLVLTEEGTTGYLADTTKLVNYLRKGAFWQYTSIALNDDDTPEASLVPATQIGLTWGYGGSFSTRVGDTMTPFLVENNSADATGTAYDVSDKDNFVEMLTVTGGTLSAAYRVR